MNARLDPVPLTTFETPVHLVNPAAKQLPRSYIWCSEFGFEDQMHKAQAAGWDCHELKTGHDAMMIVPDDLARVLMTCARAN